MNIPNILTLLRIIMVPVLVILLIQGSFFKALIVFTLASLTDALDGFLARQLNMQTELGAYLDPIADKALLASCYVTLAITGSIPAWLAVLVISRDVIILLGILVLFLMSVPFEIKPAMISKVTTTSQIITIFFILAAHSSMITHFYTLVNFLIWSTAFFTVISGLVYMHRGVRMISQYTPKAE
ncbi:MAG: CDP-diacylglycerol--glycerol-3-phosphate 3-phosphatidyltransferase [Smithellaceae bacterium]|nr:CDP-diacylglycerol--glycerol-3-phosphate 3-phosphatidyltransferase [Smithellaceae bacterium]